MNEHIPLILILLGLGSLWGLIYFWHGRQESRLHAYIIRSKAETPLVRELMQLAISRSQQCLLITLILCGVVVVVFLEKQKKEPIIPLPVLQAQLPEPIAPLHPASSAIEEAVRKEVIAKSLDELKEKYENLLVIHFYLRGCAKANEADYPLLFSALKDKTLAAGGSETDVLSTINAAKGSYQELYAHTPCTNNVSHSVSASYEKSMAAFRASP